MKIKIITCHDVYNVGASLQAYAFSAYLKKLNQQVEIINYKPKYLEHFELFGSVPNKYNKPIVRKVYHAAKFPGRLRARLSKRKREYDNFTEKYLPLTAKRYNNINELMDDPPEADIYFAGSDQIWNTQFENGKDPSFYLCFAPKGSVKASYAASFSVDKIADEYKSKISKWLSDFDFVSVRESSGVDIVNSLGIRNALQTIDPVFLLNAKEWQSLEKEINISEKYIVLYDFDMNSEIVEFARKVSNILNCKIYSVLPSKAADRSFSQEGPNAFLYLIRNAEFVISNSFHATAFSLIFNRPFVVFNRKDSINTRMRDLLSGLKMSDRIISNIDTNDLNFLKDPNYSEAQGLIDLQIQKSEQFINSVLESRKN